MSKKGARRSSMEEKLAARGIERSEAPKADQERSAEDRAEAQRELERQEEQRREEVAETLRMIQEGQIQDERVKVDAFIEAHKLLGGEIPRELLEQKARLDQAEQARIDNAKANAARARQRGRQAKRWTPSKKAEEVPSDETTFFRVERKPRAEQPVEQAEPVAEVVEEAVDTSAETSPDQVWEQWRKYLLGVNENGDPIPGQAQLMNAKGELQVSNEQLQQLGLDTRSIMTLVGMQKKKWQEVQSRPREGRERSPAEIQKEIDSLDAQIYQAERTSTDRSGDVPESVRQNAKDRLKDLRSRKQQLRSSLS